MKDLDDLRITPQSDCPMAERKTGAALFAQCHYKTRLEPSEFDQLVGLARDQLIRDGRDQALIAFNGSADRYYSKKGGEQ